MARRRSKCPAIRLARRTLCRDEILRLGRLGARLDQLFERLQVGRLCRRRRRVVKLGEFQDRNFLVHLDGPPGTSRTEMRRIVTRVSREVGAIPGVADVGGHVGRAILGDQNARNGRSLDY